MNFKKMFHTFCLLIKRDGYKRAEYIKRRNLFGAMGNDCYFHPCFMPSDPKNIFIGNNVKVASGVTFINHDIIGAMLNKKNKTNEFKYMVEDIVICDNVMIGAKAIILPGVTIGTNCIVGAGTVVSRNIPENSVVVGNPGKIVKTLTEYEESRRKLGIVSEDK